jgi:hypothetical protein
MTLADSLSSIAFFVSPIAMVMTLDKEKANEIPILLWIIHIASCFLSGIFYPQTNGLVFLLWILNFFGILWDARSSKLHAQILFLSVGFISIILKISLPSIMAVPNGGGWLIILGISLLVTLPLLVGMKFFWELSTKGFPPFAMAALLSMDYSVGLIFVNIMRHPN